MAVVLFIKYDLLCDFLIGLLDYEVLSEDGNIYAVKKVALENADASARQSFLDEIELLKRLQKYERIIKLIDFQYEANAEFLYIILEFAEIDLARTLEEFKVR